MAAAPANRRRHQLALVETAKRAPRLDVRAAV